jgi:hypothetical protein
MATAKTATSKRSYSPADLADRAVQRRAVEAVIWGMPAVNFDRMLRAAIENGGKANQVMLHGDDCSRPEVQLLSRTVERGPVLVDGAVSSGSTSESYIYNSVSIGTAGDFASISMVIVEQLSDTTYLASKEGSQRRWGRMESRRRLMVSFFTVPVNPFGRAASTGSARAPFRAIHTVTSSRWSGAERSSR